MIFDWNLMTLFGMALARTAMPSESVKAETSKSLVTNTFLNDLVCSKSPDNGVTTTFLHSLRQ